MPGLGAVRRTARGVHHEPLLHRRGAQTSASLAVTAMLCSLSHAPRLMPPWRCPLCPMSIMSDVQHARCPAYPCPLSRWPLALTVASAPPAAPDAWLLPRRSNVGARRGLARVLPPAAQRDGGGAGVGRGAECVDHFRECVDHFTATREGDLELHVLSDPELQLCAEPHHAPMRGLYRGLVPGRRPGGLRAARLLPRGDRARCRADGGGG